jgi:hypothetical protein
MPPPNTHRYCDPVMVVTNAHGSDGPGGDEGRQKAKARNQQQQKEKAEKEAEKEAKAAEEAKKKKRAPPSKEVLRQNFSSGIHGGC